MRSDHAPETSFRSAAVDSATPSTTPSAIAPAPSVPAPTGAYFVALRSGTREVTRKIVIMN